MSTNTLLILGAAGLGFYFLTRRTALPPLVAPPPVNPNGSVAGYTPPAGYPSDPSDRNSWIPAVVGLGSNLLNTALNAAGSTSSSGLQGGGSSFNAGSDSYPTDYSNPTGDGLTDYSAEF
jgi:hypothetical protein